MVDIPAGLLKVIVRAWTTFYLSNEKSETRSILTYCRQWQIHAANADTCDDRTEQTSELVGSFLKAEANWRQIGFITRKTDHQCQPSQEYDKGSAKVSSTPHWCTDFFFTSVLQCGETLSGAVKWQWVVLELCSLCWDTHLSKMAPTPALWALFLCTCSPVASKIPSFTEMERWEKEAIRSSFHPVGRAAAVSLGSFQYASVALGESLKISDRLIS